MIIYVLFQPRSGETEKEESTENRSPKPESITSSNESLNTMKTESDVDGKPGLNYVTVIIKVDTTKGHRK